jgi:hypothetical protein
MKKILRAEGQDDERLQKLQEEILVFPKEQKNMTDQVREAADVEETQLERLFTQLDTSGARASQGATRWCLCCIGHPCADQGHLLARLLRKCRGQTARLHRDGRVCQGTCQRHDGRRVGFEEKQADEIWPLDTELS